MLCASVPCVSYGTSSPSFVLPSPALFAESSFTFLHSLSLTFVYSQIYQIISCVVITFPLLTVPLPLATLCVFVCVLCVSGGLWQGIDRSHSWVNSAYAPGGSRSVLRRNPNSSCELKQVPNSSSSPSPPHHLHLEPYLKSQWFCLYPLLSASHSASHVLPVAPFHPQLHLVCLSQCILSPPHNRQYLLCLRDKISAWCSSDFSPVLHSS